MVIFKENDLITSKEAHTAACTAICKRKNGKGFITGGNDGMIITWDSNFNKVFSIDLMKDLTSKKFELMNTKIRAITEDMNQDITIGTRGGELVEIKKDGSFVVLNRGHFNKELWGLCNLNKREEFITVGEDSMLAIFDIDKRRMRKSTKLVFTARCIDCDPLGKRLAVGCKNGYVLILDISTFQIIKTIKDREQEISCIKYSADGKWLSVGGADSELLSYSVQDNYALKSRMRAHNSRILHFDFCEDSTTIQSMCTGYEIIYIRVESGKRVKNGASTLKDETWKTWSLPIGWHTQGIWPACSDGTDINAVDRSPDKALIATADDYGMVKLFRYPCPKKHSAFSKYIGHSSHVTNVKFSERGDYLITTGGNDKSIMQWKVNIIQEQGYEFIDNNDLGMDGEHSKPELDEEELLYQHLKDFDNPKFKDTQGISFDEKKTRIRKEDQIPTVKPYMGELRSSIPSNFSPAKNCSEEPNQNLEIHHVFGAKSVGVKNMVKYTSNDKIIFSCAKLGILMDPKKKYQTFFSQHTDDIVSMSLHPKKKIVATG